MQEKEITTLLLVVRQTVEHTRQEMGMIAISFKKMPVELLVSTQEMELIHLPLNLGSREGPILMLEIMVLRLLI
jgi:hypothetical protein